MLRLAGISIVSKNQPETTCRDGGISVQYYQMIDMLLACAAVFVVLVIAEIGGRRGWLRNEIGRKFVHIIVGTFVAFWPLFLSWTQIVILSFAFIVVVALSKYLSIFKSIHSVQRPTWGEIYFAASVGIFAIIAQDGWIYMAALLHMALADGLAAIVGVQYGWRNKYSIFGHQKSITGTLVFFFVSALIIAAYSIWSGDHVGTGKPLAIAVGATVFENISPRGTDNLTVPIWVAFMLAI